MIYKAKFIKNWDVDCDVGNGQWIPCRPVTFYNLWNRMKASFGVFTGKYDALDWEQ